MRDPIVIFSAARTPIGGSLGDFTSLQARQLGAAAIRAAVDRAGVEGEAVDVVPVDCCLMAGQGQAPAPISRSWRPWRACGAWPRRRTLEFRSTMEYLAFNPEWVVPPTIRRNDVLPRVLRGRGYLTRRTMRLLDGGGRVVDPAAPDWDHVREHPGAFPYRIVQAPGPDNALGRIRFVAPNEHVVFLHDTPARELFDRPVRAFSSGCIRVERPLELAELLLDDAGRWSVPRIAPALDEGRTQTLPVRRRVPLLLLYHTARAGASDRPEFRADLYGRDAPIVRALAAPFRFAPVARR